MPAVTTPSMASPMPGRSLSSTMSPGPMSLIPALSSPRSANCLAKVPAGPGEGLGEHRRRLGAGRPVRLDDDDLLGAVLGRPFRDDAGLLAEREAGAHHVGVAGIDHPGRARHHH